MTSPHVLVIVGTRPEAIKLAPVVKALRLDTPFHVSICVSGQHSARAQEQLRECGLDADIRLDPIAHPVGLSRLLTRLGQQLEPVVKSTRPALVVVQGDTATSLAAALAAFHCGVPVAHVEAGLRTGNLGAPFPEESFRRTIARIATLHFAPTSTAAAHLRAEGVDADAVHVTGNTVVDAFHDRVSSGSETAGEGSHKQVLVSLHRRESLGARLEGMFGAVRELAERYPGCEFVCHLSDNPGVGRAFAAVRSRANVPNLTSVGPLSHRAFLRLIATSDFVMTDSGGVQEEAPLLGTPVLILRNETDRPEGVVCGGAHIVGTLPADILAAADVLMTDRRVYERMAGVRSPFGDGKAARRIAAAVTRHLLDVPVAPAPCLGDQQEQRAVV